MTREATPVAMEVWRKAFSAFEGCAVQEFGTDDQAAAAVIATALADLQRRVEELEGANKVIAESHKWLYGETQRLERSLSRIATAFPGWTSERMGHIRNIARQALSDKTQEKNDG